MRRRLASIVIICILFAVLAASCSRDSNSVWDIQAQPYVRSDGSMGLSLHMISSSKDEENVQMVVTDPSGHLTWSFNAVSAKLGNNRYIGSPDISMPAGSALPKGTWNVDVLFKDGTTVIRQFDVFYEDAYVIPEDLKEAVFDSASNLTFIP